MHPLRHKFQLNSTEQSQHQLSACLVVLPEGMDLSLLYRVLQVMGLVNHFLLIKLSVAGEKRLEDVQFRPQSDRETDASNRSSAQEIGNDPISTLLTGSTVVGLINIGLWYLLVSHEESSKISLSSPKTNFSHEGAVSEGREDSSLEYLNLENIFGSLAIQKIRKVAEMIATLLGLVDDIQKITD